MPIPRWGMSLWADHVVSHQCHTQQRHQVELEYVCMILLCLLSDFMCFRFISHLGSGEFGSVSKAEWKNGRRQMTVAVKTLTDSANTVKFLQEAAIMAQFRHPNILTLHGVVSAGHPVSITIHTFTPNFLIFRRKWLSWNWCTMETWRTFS